jgi:hypothetical protein
MIENVLRAIGGVGVYDAISICIFMLIFCGALVWAFRLKPSFLQEMSSMPLREDGEIQKGEGHE